MPIGADTIVQTVFQWRMYAQTLLNVVHWRFETFGADVNEYLAANAIAAKLQADEAVAGTPVNGLLNCVSSDCLMEKVQAQIIYPVRWAFASRDITNGIGQRGANQYQNVQTCVTKKTIKSGREFVGAMHMPPSGGEDYIDGFVTAGFKAVATLQTSWLYTDYPIPAINSVLRPVLFHRGPIFPPYTDIQGREVQDQARVMVRRTIGRGI